MQTTQEWHTLLQYRASILETSEASTRVSPTACCVNQWLAWPVERIDSQNVLLLETIQAALSGDEEAINWLEVCAPDISEQVVMEAIMRTGAQAEKQV